MGRSPRTGGLSAEVSGHPHSLPGRSGVQTEGSEDIQVEILVDGGTWGLALGARTGLALAIEVTDKDGGKSARPRGSW